MSFMSSIQSVSENHPTQGNEARAFAAAIRAQAALETDPKVAESLLARAAEVEQVAERFWEEHAKLEGAIVEAKATVERLRRRDQLPWWVVVLVLSALFWFLFTMATRGSQ